MSNISMNMDSLRSLGNDIRSKGENYKHEIARVYNNVDNLANSWKGADNQSYITKVNEYKEVLNSLGDVIDNYGVFLIETANNMQKLQDEIASAANKL